MPPLSLTASAYTDSLAVALALSAEPYRCWRNAVLATLCGFAGTYIEGWGVLPRRSGIEIIEHGWGRDLDEEILDLSIVLVEPGAQPIFYFPGMQVPRDLLVTLLPGKAYLARGV